MSSSDYNETDRPTPAEFLDPDVTDGARPYDDQERDRAAALDDPRDVTVDPTEDVRRPDSGSYQRTGGLDDRGVVVDPDDEYDPGPSHGEPVPPIEPHGDGSQVKADPGPPAAGRGYYDENEVKANPGSPAAAGDYYDENEVKANPGSPAAAGDYYDENEVKANPGSPAAAGDYYDENEVKANPGSPAGTADSDDLTERRALRDDDYYEGDTSVEGAPGRRAMTDPDLSRDRNQ